jgi:hypothetical protein
MNISMRDTAVVDRLTKSPYVVVVQYRDRARTYLSCDSMDAIRNTIKQHKLIKAVTYIYYNMPTLMHIEAYDAREPDRYA